MKYNNTIVTSIDEQLQDDATFRFKRMRKERKKRFMT